MKEGFDSILKQLDGMYEDVRVLPLSDESVADIEVIPTGSIGIDYLIGAGGFPRGRYSTIVGWESSGKTTIALLAAVEAQKQGGYVGFIDMEQALDRNYAKRLGIDWDKFILTQPDSAEQALEIAKAMIRSEAFDLIILDSIAALSHQKEIEGDIADNSMGVIARMMSRFYRSTLSSLRKANTAFIQINQYREKIVMFGDPRTTPGGNAEKFYASLRIETRKTTKPEMGIDGEALGNEVHVKCLKNKVGQPYREVDILLEFGVGIDRYQEILTYGVNGGIVNKSGSWYSYGDVRLAQGKKASVEFLRDNPEIAEEIYSKIQL